MLMFMLIHPYVSLRFVLELFSLMVILGFYIQSAKVCAVVGFSFKTLIMIYYLLCNKKNTSMQIQLT
jgi:hypothetical protein